MPAPEEDVMRVFLIGAACVVSCAGPAFAQGQRAYVNVGGGVATSADATSGDVLGEVGVRVARNLFVFADVGQFHNLQPSDVQPAVDATDAVLSAQGLTVTGVARVPAWQTLGGMRYMIPTRFAASPYVLGGAGFARLTPGRSGGSGRSGRPGGSGEYSASVSSGTRPACPTCPTRPTPSTRPTRPTCPTRATPSTRPARPTRAACPTSPGARPSARRHATPSTAGH